MQRVISRPTRSRSQTTRMVALAVMLIAFMLLCVSAFYLYRFSQQRLESQRNLLILTGWEEQLRTATPAAVARELLQQELKVAQQRFAQASGLLPGVDIEIAILQRIHEAVELSGVELSSLQQEGDAFHEGALVGSQYAISVTGDLDRVTDFAIRLEEEAFPAAYFGDDVILNATTDDQYLFAGTLTVYGSTLSTGSLISENILKPPVEASEFRERAKQAVQFNDYELALSLLLQLAALEPESPEVDPLLYNVYVEYGNEMLARGRYALAKEQCEAAQSFDPDGAEAIACVLAATQSLSGTNGPIVVNGETPTEGAGALTAVATFTVDPLMPSATSTNGEPFATPINGTPPTTPINGLSSVTPINEGPSATAINGGLATPINGELATPINGELATPINNETPNPSAEPTPTLSSESLTATPKGSATESTPTESTPTTISPPPTVGAPPTRTRAVEPTVESTVEPTIKPTVESTVEPPPTRTPAPEPTFTATITKISVSVTPVGSDVPKGPPTLPPTIAPPPTGEPRDTPVPPNTVVPSNTPVPDNNNTATAIPNNNNTATAVPNNNTATAVPNNNTATAVPNNNTATAVPSNTATAAPSTNTATPVPTPTTAPTNTPTDPTATATSTGPTATATSTGPTATNTPAPSPTNAFAFGSYAPFYLPNCGLTQIKGTIRELNSNNPISGVTVHVSFDGAAPDEFYSNPSDSAGEWDVILANHAKEGQWYVQVVDGETRKALSQRETVFTDTGPCKPNEGGHQVVIQDFFRWPGPGTPLPTTAPTSTPGPSSTPGPTDTPEPSNTPTQTATATQTATNTPTITPTPTQRPIIEINNTDVPIIDALQKGVTSTIEIKDDVIIRDIRAYISITHTEISDLDINLIHPDGTIISLHTQGEDPGDKQIRQWFNSDNSDIGQLKGKRSQVGDGTDQRTWTLQVIDRLEDEIGKLLSWQLEIYPDNDE